MVVDLKSESHTSLSALLMTENPPQPRRRRRFGPISTSGFFGNSAVALLPVLACFLAGGTQKWAEGVVVALLGFLLLARPPQFSLGVAMNGVLIGFVLLSALAFLPAHWFFMPAWRTAMVNDLGIALPATLTPQPWITATGLISLVAALSWLYFVCTQDLDLRAARLQLRTFTAGVVGLAAISILLFLAHAALPFWINQRGFGPFPNRNQTADLFGISAIVLLACGQDDLRFGRNRWVIWLIGLSVLIAAVVLNLSRAGLALVVGGSALWIAVVALRQRSPGRIALAISFLLLLLTAILLMGGQTLERFHLRGLEGPGISSDFRWLIFRDAFQLIAASPWCGIGLGNFESVFAIFRAASWADTRSLHPESDWLWAWVELGWPAVVLALVGAALLIWRVFPLREGTNQRFRFAALIGVVLFALHGIVDVSAHRVGTAFTALFLCGLAVHRPFTFAPSRWTQWLFRLVAMLLIVSGLAWAITARTKALLPGSVGVTNAKESALDASAERDFAAAVSLTSRALVWAPLDWRLYFLRALAEVADNHMDVALDDFRRARFLEPNGFEVPLAEGNAWLPSQPMLAVTAWREALRRGGSRRAEIFSIMLTNAANQSPVASRVLSEIGLARHDLVLPYLNRVSGEDFQRALAQVLKNDPELATFTEPEKFALFTLWSERGVLDDLARQIESHPNWMPYGWLGVAKHHAAQKDFRVAYELTQSYGESAALPRVVADSSLEELQNRFVSAPENYAVGYALYRAQMQRGRVDDALQTARHFSERPTAPAYFHLLESECWAAKQNWERAWSAWQAFEAARAK
ncbi:MAG: O-antigen ligase family protein [Chthoniobacterales bacterium]